MTTGNITIPIIDDDIYENDETLTLAFGDLSEAGLRVGNNTGGAVISGTTVTITDNDALSISFAAAALTLPEDAGTVNVGMRLNRASAIPVTFQIAAAPGTPAATLGTDYSIPNTSVTFNAGATTAMVALSITDDSLVEGNELFELSVENPSPSARVTTPAAAVITIEDNDVRTLSVTATPAFINEGEMSTLTITANPAPTSDLTIPFTINGSGIVPGDYTLTVGGTALTALTGNVTLPMNQTSLALTLTSVDDADTIEETLTLTLNAGTGYRVSSRAGSAKVTINPFAQTTAQFAASNVEVAENVSGGMVAVTVELNGRVAGATTIPIMTADDTATAGTDYTTTTTDVVIAAGATTGTAMIPILDDGTYEADEAFMVSFGTLPTGVTAGASNRASVIILDDEELTITGFSSDTLSVNEDVGTLVVTVEFGLALPAPLDIKYTWSAGTATLVDDFLPDHLQQSILVPAGATGFTLRATIVDDAGADPGETILINLVSASRVMITNPTTTITINPAGTAIMPALSVVAAPTTIAEGAASTITITANSAPADDLIIPFTIAGTDIEASDYMLTGATDMTGLTGNVTLSASTRSVALTLTAVDDADTDPEMLTFTLDTPAGTDYTVATSTATITIDPAAAPVTPALSVAASPTTITEGAASTITITATSAPAGNLTIPYTIAGSGIAAGDYTLADASGTELTGLTGNITLAGSATSVALTLTAADDSDASAEMLTFTLGTGAGYTVATATATIRSIR